MLENVKNLVGKKFRAQFDEWCEWLDGIGYNTYWQVLNAKDYGVPQNREARAEQRAVLQRLSKGS